MHSSFSASQMLGSALHSSISAESVVTQTDKQWSTDTYGQIKCRSVWLRKGYYFFMRRGTVREWKKTSAGTTSYKHKHYEEKTKSN